MNAAILVLASLSALLVAPVTEPPASETTAITEPTECGAVDPLAVIGLDEAAGICADAPATDEPEAFDAGVDGIDGPTARPTTKPPKPLGWCRCGCGIRCSTSADCGGASCDRFITCC